MATTNREGRGETTGPTGTRADASTRSAGVGTTDTTAYTNKAEAGGGGTPPPPPERPVQYYFTTPMIYEVRSSKKKKKRKKYSRGLKTVQRTEDGVTLASKRVGSAIEDGFRSYRKRRNKSARRKKDGPLRDILPNSTGGFGRFLREASDTPYDVARKVNSKRLGKQIRDTVQFFTQPLFR